MMNRDRRGGGRNRREERQSEFRETVVKINRCAKVVKGGRRFSFSCLSVVGDEKGKVAVGYGKANDVPSAIQKAMKIGRVAMESVVIVGDTIPHEVIGVFGSSRVLLKPARPGTGIIAGSSVRAVVEDALDEVEILAHGRKSDPVRGERRMEDGGCRKVLPVEYRNAGEPVK